MAEDRVSVVSKYGYYVVLVGDAFPAFVVQENHIIGLLLRHRDGRLRATLAKGLDDLGAAGCSAVAACRAGGGAWFC